MKKIILLFICFSSIAQNNSKILLEKIKTHAKQDTIRVELLVDACVAGTFQADSVMLSYAKEAYFISNKINYELGKIRSLNCIGNYYFQKSNFDKATELYMKALQLAEKTNDQNNIVIGKSNLANIFCRVGKQQEAIKLLKQCDAILLKRGDSLAQNRAAILTNLATAFSSIDKHEIAILYYKKVYSICKKGNIVFGLGITSANLASEYYESNNYPMALSSASETLKIAEENKLGFLKSSAYKTIGLTYIALKNNKLGIENLKLSEKNAIQIDDKETLLTVYENLHSAYYNSNDIKNAYLNCLNFISIKDTMYSIESKKTIEELNTKYQTEKKETAIKNLTQDKKIGELRSQQKTFLIYSIIGSVLALGLLFYFMFIRYKTKKQNELLKVQLQEAEKTIIAEKNASDSEMKALKSQMNPHFIFNALNSIQEQFMYGDKVVANEQMGNFTYLTRQILEVSGKKQITLSKEIDILTKYLELEKMRFDNNFEYSITINDSIDEDYTQIPPMMLQPFVENSVKHGLLHKKGEKKLTINFYLSENDEFLIAQITDNGIGRKESEKINKKNNSKHESFSIQSINQRLKMLNNNQIENLVVYEDLFDENGASVGTNVKIKIKVI
ncbi:histidine kinase [Flavobacterium sp.]|uniref:tetratricopeptide repeat-containing sensor histidine kinase n=1 Tax=Flavobacterium sp. TaxID=239 RepID=UPI0038FC7DDC